MSKQKKIIGFIALSIAMFMGTLDSTIIQIALPQITNYFHSNLNYTSWISTIYVMGLAVFTITASKLADQFGRKKIMIIGLVLFGMSSALCGLAQSLIFLIIMRFLQGIGAAIITPIVVPMGLDIFGKEKLQTVGGAIGGITALAAAAGPPIGGLIIEYINWQSIFYVNVPFALISFVLIALFVEESYDKTTSKSIDFIGMLLLSVTLFLITFALLKGKDYGWNSLLIISMFVGSIVAFILFIMTENKVKSPMIEIALFRERTFTASSICYLITGFGLSSPLIIFSYFLQDVLEYKPLEAAFIIMAMSLTVVVSMPLGTVIAKKFSAKPINFLGILFLSFSAYLLSRLKFSTSKPVMITDMIVCGFGLGFACQSIISLIKYLPVEKSGIAQGIVNAARQVGTCLGIALLVSVLNTNVTNAKTDIKSNADSIIKNSSIADTVKTIMIDDINNSLNVNKDNDSSIQQQTLKKKMEDDIHKTFNSIPDMQKPTDKTLAKLYDGADSLRKGTVQVINGQKSLNTGIDSLSSGIDSLSNGSNLLTSGLENMNNGVSQAVSGAQDLNSGESEGLNMLSSGISQLDNGAQKLFSQFLPGSLGNKTIYDGVTGVADGTQSLSSNLSNYTLAVDNTYYLMIKNDPMSLQLLKTYKNNLEQAEIAYASATGTAKEQYKQQIEVLANLVSLYMVGTDPSVINEAQFATRLENLAHQSEISKNVVASGNMITSAANQLSDSSKKVAAQFKDGGTFKSGAEQLVNGTSKLKQGTVRFSPLQQGINKLLNGLHQFETGSNHLLAGSKSLQSGIFTAKNGSSQLQYGCEKMLDANIKTKDGATQIVSGIGMAGQKNEIENVIKQIQTEKNDKLAGAFDNVFLIAALILIPLSVCGLFTDEKLTKTVL